MIKQQWQHQVHSVLLTWCKSVLLNKPPAAREALMAKTHIHRTQKHLETPNTMNQVLPAERLSTMEPYSRPDLLCTVPFLAKMLLFSGGWCKVCAKANALHPTLSSIYWQRKVCQSRSVDKSAQRITAPLCGSGRNVALHCRKSKQMPSLSQS